MFLRNVSKAIHVIYRKESNVPYKNREKYLSAQRGYYNEDKDAYKWRTRLYLHKITKEQFFDLLEKQSAKCALCDKEFPGIFGKDMHIDHCHDTGKIRGILCKVCNVGLGMLGDDIKGIEKALKYVKGELV